MSDELWKARFNVKRAVLDLVANEYHEVDMADKCAYSDYVSDMLDEALKEYAVAYFMENEFPLKEELMISEALDIFFNRRAD